MALETFVRVLILEDDKELAQWLRSAFTTAIGATDVFSTIEDAEAALDAFNFDLIVIDRGLPDGDGLSLLSKISACKPRPATLFLTAYDDPTDILTALDGGADEYICKPFEPPELIARARAVLRRYNADRSGLNVVGNLSFDTHHRTVEVNHIPVEIPRRELAILEALIRRAGQVVQRDRLEGAVYCIDDEIESNALDSHVSRLRRRLREAGCSVQIKTVRGLGYVVTPQ